MNLTPTLEDSAVIDEIAKRAAALYGKMRPEGASVAPIQFAVSVAAAHLNGCPLRLNELLAADDGQFGHDVFGIDRYVDRATGVIPAASFWPRYAANN